MERVGNTLKRQIFRAVASDDDRIDKSHADHAQTRHHDGQSQFACFTDASENFQLENEFLAFVASG